jgi:regulator of sigma D
MKKYTPSVLNYISFDFFCAIFDRLVLFNVFAKNKKFKAIFKVYYMLNNVTAKINNNYDFLIRRVG